MPSHPGQGAPGPQPLPGVDAIIAVGSGKGGVGKTTLSVNLAVALAKMGHKVGLLDADVYGPNVPLMLGVNAQPKMAGENRIEPLEAFGLKVISVGFLNPGRQAHHLARSHAAPDCEAIPGDGGVGPSRLHGGRSPARNW